MDSRPIDFEVRQRFATAVDVNFSLITPAGAGKTRSVSDRVAEIGCQADAIVRLPRMVVVTYTNKAADELRQRSGAAIRGRNVSERVLNAFERAFFGTIHSFGSQLLRDFGHYIGVPATFENATDGESLWKRFLLSASHKTDDEFEARLFRHCSFETVRTVVEGWDERHRSLRKPGAAPSLDFSAVFAYKPKRAASVPTVARGCAAMRSFLEAWTSGDGFAALPNIDEGGAEFIDLCRGALAPATRWLRRALLHTAGRMHADFRRWRVSQALLTYDDQIALAAGLFENPEAARAIRERKYSVILDEAQDTDPLQFALLLEAARPVEASAAWTSNGELPPAPGRFSMVGDLQQSIYSSRADLNVCRRVHAYLTTPGVGEALSFSTTFRCDRRVIGFVNEAGPNFLAGAQQQVSYIPLTSRNGAGEGAVMRLNVIPDAAIEDPTAEELLRQEGARIGAFLRTQGLAGLGITAWNQVALLAPRTMWLGALKQGLLSEGVRSTVLSQSGRLCDSPAHLWTAALATVLTQPRNTWEVVGVLRDVYGLSDAALAEFACGDGTRFELARGHDETTAIGVALRELAEVRQLTAKLPLSDAFELIDRRILRPRLRALPVERYGDTDRGLNDMAATAAKIEAEGGDMVSFALHLSQHLEETLEAQGDDPSAVCLLTNHKSKGLEWPVVILPALFRPLSFERPSYPRVTTNADGQPDLAFCVDDACEHDTRRATLKRDEMERLLYVSLTRARRVLILCDDRALWAAGEEVPDWSLAKALQIDRAPARLSALPDTLIIEAPTVEAPRAPATVSAFEVDLAKASAASLRVPQKLTPHRLVSDHDHEGPEARRDEREPLPVAATVYGTWWHETMRTLPWGEPARWDAHAITAMSACPVPERGAREWALFACSPLAERLRNAKLVRTECPFLVPTRDEHALEGVIDLVYRGADGRWHVVDWKTTQSHSIESAVATYGPQIRPYRDVISQLLGEADATVYLTPTGEDRQAA